MGAPLPDMEKAENASAEALLDSLKTIDPAERRKHASVFSYWLSIRANRPFPPIRDLDPLEISDAGPWSVLLEMIGGGEDAVIRHLGLAIKDGVNAEKVGDAPSPSLLSCIHSKLPIVAACREAFAFEDSFETADGPRRCWVTLLPFSQTGTWIDFVYGYVSLEGAQTPASDAPVEAVEADLEAAEDANTPEAVDEPEVLETTEETVAEQPEPEPEPEPEPFKVELQAYDEEPEAAAEVQEAVDMPAAPEAAAEAHAAHADPEPVADLPEPESFDEPEPEPVPAKAGFSAKLLGGLASSFYGKVTQSAPPADDYAEPEVDEYSIPEPQAEPEPEPEPEAPVENTAQPATQVEGNLHSKLTDVRAMAAEAREAQIRSNIALYEGLSAAYDFALDAEDEPEEYLRLVEGQGLKIQLRSPMKPVVKLAFDGMCDDPTIKQLEAVLAWALKQDLPRGTLATRIQEEGGIGEILNGAAA